MSVPVYDTPPRNRTALEQRLRNIARARDTNELRLRRTLANAIVSQMLPPGVVKGGTAMKLRVGEAGSRFTPDFDAARSANVTVDDYIDAFEKLLAAGWHGFTARIVRLEPSDPPDVPADYVMRPFAVRLSYRAHLSALADAGRRLFAARRVAAWRPAVRMFPGWEAIYVEQAAGLDVRSLVDAVEWINQMIAAATSTT